MEQFQTQNTGFRRTKYRTVLAAMGAVLICSAGFAAVKYDTIKSWLVTVEINGEVTQVELTQLAPGEPAAGSFTIDTRDGEADVTVEKWESEDGSEASLTVLVHQDDGSGEDVEVFGAALSRVRRAGADHTLLSTDLLGDAAPVAGWQTADGQTGELYLIPGQEGQATSVYMLIRTDLHSDSQLTQVGSIPADLLGDGIDPAVQVDGEGGVTLTLDDGENVNVLKFRTQTKFAIGEGSGPDGLDRAFGAGGISITVTDPKQDQE